MTAQVSLDGGFVGGIERGEESIESSGDLEGRRVSFDSAVEDDIPVARGAINGSEEQSSTNEGGLSDRCIKILDRFNSATKSMERSTIIMAICAIVSALFSLLFVFI